MDRIQLRRDSSARWAEINPILLEGEVGYEIDTKLRKIGDGVNRWNDLEYLKAEGISQETGNSQNLTMSQDAITRELAELGSKVGSKTISLNIKSRNIDGDDIVITAKKDGYYIDGIFYNTGSDELYKYTDLIAVSKGVYNVVNIGSGTVDKVGIYSEDGVFIRSVKSVYDDIRFEVTENEKFVRFVSSKDGNYTIRVMAEQNIEEKSLRNDYCTAVKNIFSDGKIKKGYYIGEDLSLKYGNPNYVTSLFEVKESGWYYITTGSGYERPILVKYTNDSYTDVSTAIITGLKTDFTSCLYIEKGFYGFTFNMSQIGNPTFVSMRESNKIIESTANKYSVSLIEHGKYMTSLGVISSGVNNMKFVKMYLTEGFYYIANIGSIHGILIKYTTGSYENVDTIYYSNNEKLEDVVYLSEGYYGLSWNANISDEYPIFVEAKWLNAYLSHKYIVGNTVTSIENKKYINADGVISSASGNYNLAKFHIIDEGLYLVEGNVHIPSGHPIIGKYTDQTYSTLDKFILRRGVDKIDGIFHFEKGYYAVASYGGSDIRVVNTGKSFDIIKIASRISAKEVGGVNGFENFDDVSNSWTITNERAISSVVGYNNRLVYPNTTYEDKFVMSCVVSPDGNGLFSLVIGKWKNTSGTVVKIGNDNGQYASVCRVDENGELLKVVDIDLSSFVMGVGKEIAVTMTKDFDTESYISIRLSDSFGNVVVKERITCFVEKSGTKWNVGLAHGNITMYSLNGLISFRRLEFGYPKSSDIKVAFIGHSFVEGNNSTSNDKNKRFVSLLADDIGNDRCGIFGLGGGGVGMIKGLQEQVTWLENLKYAIIMLGANDGDTENNAECYGNFNHYLNSLGIKTIWVAIPPLRDGSQAKPIIDAYIRNHFSYVDVNNAFYDVNGNIDTLMFSDNIHPSIEGYRKMYDIIKTQCSVLWTV